MNLYISDTHFGRRNVINFDKRPFADIEQMDWTLIAFWNDRVEADDDVWILGDFCYRSELAFNTGCMINNYTPAVLREIIENNKRFYERAGSVKWFLEQRMMYTKLTGNTNMIKEKYQHEIEGLIGFEADFREHWHVAEMFRGCRSFFLWEHYIYRAKIRF